jgi:serine protease AprX
MPKSARRPPTKPAPRARAARLTAAPASLAFAAGIQHFVGGNKALEQRVKELGQAVQFTVTPKTRSGKPIQGARGMIAQVSLDDYRPDTDAMAGACDRLVALGFEVLRTGRFGISVRGDPALVNDVLGTQLTIFARPGRDGLRSTRVFNANMEPPGPTDLFAAPPDSLTVKSQVSENIDHFIFVPPPLFFAPPSALPPTPAYHHVDSAAIRGLLRVPSGGEGAGIKVAVIDTGFFPHPFFAAGGFQLTAVDTTSAPRAAVDAVGHGTAIALNVFAIAPKAEVFGYKQSTPPEAALEEAADAGVDVISCSWGWDHEQSFPVLEATIRSIAEEDGIPLVVATGNGHFAWPGSMAEVLSVGGVFSNPAGGLEASDYASGFVSSLYPGRRVPDFCGLCGPAPRGIYIPMPCPPGCDLDRRYARGTYPDNDETGATDGWVVASGTSSATPQIAGVVALLLERAKQLGKQLTIKDLRNVLESTAQAVQKGRNALGFPAVGHPNTACGFGLVDATAALAKI